MGAKHLRTLYEHFHFKTIDELEQLAKEHKIQSVKGFGPKLEAKIAKELRHLKQEGYRFLYSVIEPYAEQLKVYLQRAPTLTIVEIAGSFRRKKETVGDLDIVAAAKEPAAVIDYFVKFSEISEVVSAGKTRATIILKIGLQVDLRVVNEEFFCAALHYFTGSKAHVVTIQKMVQERGWKINEYGLLKRGAISLLEAILDIYSALGMRYIEPELREMRGEIEAAINNTLPNLVIQNELKRRYLYLL